MRRKSDKIPDLIVNRDGTDVTVDSVNIRDRIMKLFRAPESKSVYDLVDELTIDDLPYNESVGATEDVKYKAAFLDVELGVVVLEIDEEDDPPFIEFELVGGTTANETTVSYNVAWDSEPLVVDIIELENVPTNSYSQAITTRKT